MISIPKATEHDATLLSNLAKTSFFESHGHSASPADIEAYANKHYTEHALQKELQDPANIYHIIFFNDQPAGYSKIILNSPCPESDIANIAKLDRIYLLRNFYDLNLGSAIFEFNINLAKRNNQAGIWLYTWKENQRALRFYQKHGFVIIGSYEFKISDTHANPNHQMLLRF